MNRHLYFFFSISVAPISRARTSYNLMTEGKEVAKDAVWSSQGWSVSSCLCRSFAIPEPLVMYQFPLAFQHMVASIAANCWPCHFFFLTSDHCLCPVLTRVPHSSISIPYRSCAGWEAPTSSSKPLPLQELLYLSEPRCLWHWEECLGNWATSSNVF